MSNIAKGTMDARVEFFLPKSLLSTGHITSSCTNLDQTSSESRPNGSISTKLKLKNLDQTKPESWPRMNFIATTKHQQQNNDQTSASKSCLNINLKILTKSCPRSLTKSCAQSLNKNLTLRPNFTFQMCTKLLSTRFSSSTWATVTTSTSFELPSSHARVTSIKFTKQESVS